MKIALATSTEDCSDPQSWSGIPWHLAEALRSLDGVEVCPLGPLDVDRRVPEALRRLWYRARGERFVWQREPRIIRAWSRQLERRLSDVEVDAVMTFGSIAARCLPDEVPRLVFTDSTWHRNIDYYPTLTGICGRSRRLGEELDRVAYTRADHTVITSEWGRQDLIEHYGVRPDAVSAVPIGANTVCPLDAATLADHAARRLDAPLRLFWIGVEWERKGGDIAMAAAEELHRRGVPVELHVAGRTPELPERPWLHQHGFLNFTTDRERAQSVFLASSVLFLPTRAEDAGIVFAEAASFAVPSIGPATGGVPTMIEDGVNGVLLRENAEPIEYADALEELWADPDRYLALAASSRARFEREMTWAHVAQVIVEKLSLITGRPSSTVEG